ncbi:hypothetical protein PEX1_085870 [Penicillium expansum]|uniref:Uncharacterized protein n=1 Tax=Penicillium expansum TaxID=27334 RepID=A0A0A2JCW1_PENEN|nr:hypothetical protein PEX2_058170 [Penicillium expansum]KGO40062.1 hypothetical protein PEXP_034460 [Penicillium expansum]KGO50033.1 hypothetical protein PEX1_085870 [Penicillium expansum]KGO53174.1 hypothetical protein PEX2_058170 [Penicillium expansum]
MGIPMWREPSKAEASKSASEKDSSSTARSSIRRGPSRHSSSRVRRADILASFHSQIIDELRRGTVEPRRVPRFSFIPPNGAIENAVALEQAERDALVWAQARAASAPRQTETANQRFRSHRDQALTDLIGRIDGQPRNTNASPSLTPNFAPALAYHTSASSTPSDSGVRLPPMRERYNSDRASNTSFQPDIPESRSHNTQTRPTRDPVVDGLGDRQRSPSPDAERETDAWETLLSTITPDATLPSANTSFTSTSAAAPDISRNARPRSSVNLTQMTAEAARAHFALDPYPDQLNPCDFSSSDDEDAPSTFHEFMGRAGRYPDQNSTMSNHPPVPIPTIIPASVLALSDGRRQNPSLSDRHHQNDDLHHMQVILDRLARREDIPDDWWAAAGLARTLDRGLSASMDSPNTEGASRTTRDN